MCNFYGAFSLLAFLSLIKTTLNSKDEGYTIQGFIIILTNARRLPPRKVKLHLTFIGLYINCRFQETESSLSCFQRLSFKTSYGNVHLYARHRNH